MASSSGDQGPFTLLPLPPLPPSPNAAKPSSPLPSCTAVRVGGWRSGSMVFRLNNGSPENDLKRVISSLLMGFFLRDLSSKKAGFLVFLAHLGGLGRLLEVSRSRGGRRPEDDAPRPPKSLL
ncbi:hypothetical protein MTR_3g011080 [Medicago truncatula]|uniref:Uncharacterized protein n=1 Tax=Medicago truncatula TaxID=3880 RepID=G8A1M8_MEDTR|nr:hypothetical protein MTR_3g011080 [Medicago truncatula]